MVSWQRKASADVGRTTAAILEDVVQRYSEVYVKITGGCVCNKKDNLFFIERIFQKHFPSSHFTTLITGVNDGFRRQGNQHNTTGKYI